MAKKRKAKKGKIKRKRTAKKNNPKKRSPRKPVPRAIAKSEKEKAKVNFSPKLLRRSHLPSSLYRKLRANSVTHDSKIWRCAWPR